MCCFSGHPESIRFLTLLSCAVLRWFGNYLTDRYIPSCKMSKSIFILAEDEGWHLTRQRFWAPLIFSIYV